MHTRCLTTVDRYSGEGIGVGETSVLAEKP
jgi:hypothetical protein